MSKHYWWPFAQDISDKAWNSCCDGVTMVISSQFTASLFGIEPLPIFVGCSPSLCPVMYIQPPFFPWMSFPANHCFQISSIWIDVKRLNFNGLLLQILTNAQDLLFYSLPGETLSGDTCSSLDGNVRANVIKEYVCNSPHRISGRYVFITIPSKTASLNLCEVQIYAVYECKCNVLYYNV